METNEAYFVRRWSRNSAVGVTIGCPEGSVIKLTISFTVFTY